MNITKKSRTQLKTYFVTNAKPTQTQFEELIDGMLNQADDRIVKLPDQPLSIEALGDFQNVVNFYNKLEDDKPPAWSLQLNPSADGSDPAKSKSGFCVADQSNVPRLFIDKATGNIGIGTVTPIAKLDIALATRSGSHSTTIKGLYLTGDFAADIGGIELRNSDGTQGIGIGTTTIYAAGSGSNQDLQLKPKGTGALRVVSGVLTATDGISIEGVRTSHIEKDGAFYRKLDSFSGAGNCFITLGNTLFFRKINAVDGSPLCNVNVASGSFNSLSDSRLKREITPLLGMLDKILTLEGVFFKWKDSPSDDNLIGLIAQDVNKVLPELVSTDPGDMLSVNYNGFIAVLIEAIKEQQAQIQQLFALVKS
jgi:Chaperone of endosialidase